MFNKKKTLILIAFFVSAGISLTPILVNAQGGLLAGIGSDCYNKGDCTLCDLAIVAANIFRFFREIAFYIAVLMVVLGGLMLIFSGGSSQRIGSGRKILSSAIIGFAIVVGVSLILNTVLTIATGSSLTWQSVVNGRLGCPVFPKSK